MACGRLDLQLPTDQSGGSLFAKVNMQSRPESGQPTDATSDEQSSIDTSSELGAEQPIDTSSELEPEQPIDTSMQATPGKALHRSSGQDAPDLQTAQVEPTGGQPRPARQVDAGADDQQDSLERRSMHSLDELEAIDLLEARLGLRPQGGGGRLDEPASRIGGQLRFLTDDQAENNYLCVRRSPLPDHKRTGFLIRPGRTQSNPTFDPGSRRTNFSHSDQFRQLFERPDAVGAHLRAAATGGQLRSSCFRSLCWKVRS